jgi:hypothetical protein
MEGLHTVCACIVQCPRDALRFRYEDGRIVESAKIRRTRINMEGRRTVQLPKKRLAFLTSSIGTNDKEKEGVAGDISTKVGVQFPFACN